MATILDPISFVESHFSIRLKRVGRYEYAGPCGWCGEGEDRLRLFVDGSPRLWCRVCSRTAFVDGLEDTEKLSPQEYRIRKLEAEQAKARREREEMQRRLTAVEIMARSTAHLKYHAQLDEAAVEHWLGQGLTRQSMDRWLLGYCHRCPTARNGSPSWTIPVLSSGGTLLENIRHRLVRPSGGKYRPERSDLGIQLFQRDFLEEGLDRILLVEGAVKSMVLTQHGFPSIAIMGKKSFRKSWLPSLQKQKSVLVGLDPDAQDSAIKLAKLIGHNARLVSWPCKPDDMVTLYGASSDDIESFLRLARPV